MKNSHQSMENDHHDKENIHREALFDTHCHPQLPQFDPDRDAMIDRAVKNDVLIICVGTDLETSRSAIVLAEAYEGIWASVGLHPNDNLDEQYDESAYRKLAEHPKVVAIGEIGLDYYRTTEKEKKKIQKERFLKQIDLATQTAKPLIIHCRDGSTPFTTSAHEDMITILSQKYLQRKKRKEEPVGVIHSFSGTLDEAKKYIDLGFLLGVNGIVTFQNVSAEFIRTLANLPVDKILLETDAPFLAPAPYRGKRNEPSYIIEVAKTVAHIKNISLRTLMEATTKNAKGLFFDRKI